MSLAKPNFWRGGLLASLIYAGCLALVFPLAVLSFYFGVAMLFYAPQFLFGYEHLVATRDGLRQAVFSPGVGAVLSWLQWGVIGVVFAVLTRKLSPGLMFVLAVGTIVLVGAGMSVCFGLLGCSVQLDAP